MLEIPLRAIPSQQVTVSLSDQACQISVRQETYGLFLDLSVNNTPVVLGVICEDRNRIVRDLYLGFAGDFFFVDRQGTSDPDYTGLNTRFALIYIEPSELPTGEG